MTKTLTGLLIASVIGFSALTTSAQAHMMRHHKHHKHHHHHVMMEHHKMHKAY